MAKPSQENFYKRLNELAGNKSKVNETNITNGTSAIKIIKEEVGINIDIISGTQEALYTVDACSHLVPNTETDITLVADIGGGSTELNILESGKIKNHISIPFGAVNTDVENTEITTQLKNQIENFVTKSFNYKSIFLCGGTATTIPVP